MLFRESPPLNLIIIIDNSFRGINKQSIVKIQNALNFLIELASLRKDNKICFIFSVLGEIKMTDLNILNKDNKKKLIEVI